MKKSSLTTLIATTFSLAILESAQASKDEMEKCQIIGYNKAGEETGLIKEGMGDCPSATSTCAGSNKAGDKKAWIYLPKGVCEKIQGGKVVK
jgi:uncharacterized membrane protein